MLLTQLLESCVSTKASPMSDALALSGLEHVAAGLLPSVENGAADIEARSHMAYGALLSGITLANAGLGVVHGYAGPLGGFHPIPHGVVCGTLIGEATRVTIEELFKDADKNRVALRKYARAGSILACKHPVSVEHDCDLLVRTLSDWIARTGIPRLGHYGPGSRFRRHPRQDQRQEQPGDPEPGANGRDPESTSMSWSLALCRARAVPPGFRPACSVSAAGW